MNGVRVKVGDDKKTIFIPLPPELWRLCAIQPCDCPTCKENGRAVAYWDTLAVAANVKHTWVVHMPALHKHGPYVEQVAKVGGSIRENDFLQLHKLDTLPQRQSSLNSQLLTLIPFANKLGCYDAADYLKTAIGV